MNQRRQIIEGWLWWSTFRLTLAHGYGIVNSYSVAQAAVSDMWRHG